MSNISNIHSILPLTKTSSALSGQRLIRLIAKASRDGKYQSPNLTESLCVSVPRVRDDDIVEVIEKFIPHMVRMCEDVQDKITREYRIESGRDEIPQDVISIESVLAYMEADSAGDRVSKEYLAEWFMDGYSSVARAWIQDISNNSISDGVVEQKCNVLRDLFAGWASPKYSPNIPSLKAIIRFGTHAVDIDAADGRMESIIARASKVLERKEKEMDMDALGF